MEEVSFRPPTIEGQPTTTAAFLGVRAEGPMGVSTEPLHSLSGFERTYGRTGPLWEAARGFFSEGGRRLHICRAEPGREADGLAELEQTAGISIVAAPGNAAAARSLIEHVEKMRYRMALIDPPAALEPAAVIDFAQALDSSRAALYYPWVRAGGAVVPPSALVAGVYARNDLEHSVAKAPANQPLRTAAGLERDLSRAQLETLNPAGVNCLRLVRGRGVLVWGARTLSKDPEWKYVSVRRYLAFLEESIDKGTQWAVFEPNGEELWSNVRRTVEDFLYVQWRSGLLMGARPQEAYFVRCDRTTMTQDDIDTGRLICLVGVAPVKPAEFVIFRIGQWTANPT